METASARSCPAQPASIKGYSEIHSGDVNNDSGPRAICVPHPAGIRIHIAPESVFTISRNAYSHAPEYAASEVCNPTKLIGRYAYQLSGSTTISGAPKPTASLGRITFDGSSSVSGTASATFSGVRLGNPVTGTYEAKSDCSVTWKLQDDSGAFQNFSGTLSPDGTRVQFRQTDLGGAQRGIMPKTSDTCSAADLQKRYRFTISASTTPMRSGGVAHTISTQGTLDVADNGSFQADSDCSVHFVLTLPPGPCQ